MQDQVITAAQDPDTRYHALVTLEGPPLPWLCEKGWSVFVKLHQKRRASAVGPLPITDGDILNHMRLRGVVLTPFDVAVIDEADDAFRAHVAGLMPKSES